MTVSVTEQQGAAIRDVLIQIWEDVEMFVHQ